jgi:hypothetical protein
MVNVKNRNVYGFGLMLVLIAGVVLTSGCARTPTYTPTYTPGATDSGPPPAGEEVGTPSEPPPGKEACECFETEDLSAVFGTFQEYTDRACEQDLRDRPLTFGGGSESQYAGKIIDLGDEEACQKHVSFHVENAIFGLTQTVVIFSSEEEAENALSSDKDEIESWRRLAGMTTWFRETELTYGTNSIEHYSYSLHYGTKIRHEKVAGNRLISNFFSINAHTTELDELEEDDPLLESLVAKIRQFNRR